MAGWKFAVSIVGIALAVGLTIWLVVASTAPDPKQAVQKNSDCAMYDKAWKALAVPDPTPAAVAQMAQIQQAWNQIGCS